MMIKVQQQANYALIVSFVCFLLTVGFTLSANASNKSETYPCGGDFNKFLNHLKSESIAKGYTKSQVDNFYSNAQFVEDVIRRDRQQGIFRKSFIEFSKLVMSQYRINMAANFEIEHRAIFDLVEERFGVSRGVLLSFLALETDFGLVQGDHNTLNALLTLAYDCRRPELFRPHIFAALELYHKGHFDPDTTVGAWAGEIGMIQMLPLDILNYGQDGDGDGQIDLKNSVADALMTAGKVLQDLGWQPKQPWLVEVRVPNNLNWKDTGLTSEKTIGEWFHLGVNPRSDIQLDESIKASILLPHGRKGPAFFACPNFMVYFEWNQSSVYSTTSAFFATLLSGQPMYLDGNPEPPLTDEQVLQLQRLLQAKGHDVGAVDGIVGRNTRAAVKFEQSRLGLPADEWPTTNLLSLLEN